VIGTAASRDRMWRFSMTTIHAAVLRSAALWRCCETNTGDGSSVAYIFRCDVSFWTMTYTKYSVQLGSRLGCNAVWRDIGGTETVASLLLVWAHLRGAAFNYKEYVVYRPSMYACRASGSAAVCHRQSVLPIGTVMSRLARARVRLIAIMRTIGEDGSDTATGSTAA